MKRRHDAKTRRAKRYADDREAMARRDLQERYEGAMAKLAMIHAGADPDTNDRISKLIGLGLVLGIPIGIIIGVIFN